MHTPHGKIETIPQADDIFKVVPVIYEQARQLIEGKSLFAYMRYGCGSCQAKVDKLNMRGKERLVTIANERGVALVYLDIVALQFRDTLVREQQADRTASSFILYYMGNAIRRHDGFPFADDLADWIEQHFPVQ